MIRLTPLGIALKNIRRSPRRSLCLILTVLLLSFFMFAGSVAFIAMSRGMKSVSDRLGADLIVVPMDYTAKVGNLILTGAPSTFFLPKDAEDQLKRFSNVIEASTPQVFLATLNESCCSAPLQLMGLDSKTDFLIKPWLVSSTARELEDGQIIVGSNVNAETGGTLKFFNRPYTVAGKLAKTGMGFDDSVFMTRNTLCQAAADASFLLDSPLAKDKSLISAVMVRLKPGQDAGDLAMDMNRALNRGGLYVMSSHSFISGMSVTLRGAARFALWGGALLWLLAASVISLLFSVTLNERRTEMAMLRTVGASRGQLTRMILDEVLILCLEGAVLGVLLGACAAALSAPQAAEALKLPFLLPQLSVLLLIAGATVLLSVLTGLLAAYRAARRVSKADIYSTLRGK